MQFFLVFKALVCIYLISFSCAEEEQEEKEAVAVTCTTDTETGRNRVYQGSREGMVVTAFLIRPDFHMFKQKVDNPEFKEKAACFELEENVVNSIKLKPVKFEESGTSKAGDFSLLYTKIFSCLTHSLYAFLRVERQYKVLSPFKEIHYDPNVLQVKDNSKWYSHFTPSCLQDKKTYFVTENSFRNQTDINTVIRLNDGVKVTFYDKEYMENRNFWP